MISDSFPWYSKKKDPISQEEELMRVYRTRGWRTKGKGMCAGEKTTETNYKKKERREALAGELAVCSVPWISGNAPSHASNMKPFNVQREGGVGVLISAVVTPHCLLHLVTSLKS